MVRNSEKSYCSLLACLLIYLNVIDNVCTESLSIDLTKPLLDQSVRNIQTLSAKIEDMEQSGSEQLQQEYKRLVDGMRERDQNRDEYLANPGRFCWRSVGLV